MLRAGSVMRMEAADFIEACKNSELSRILHHFIHSLMTQISQSAACNRFHQIEARLGRWLLMTADRMKANEFIINQEFLSNMLRVRREAVTIAAGNLQTKGLISYKRRYLKILNRTALEMITCNC